MATNYISLWPCPSDVQRIKLNGKYLIHFPAKEYKKYFSVIWDKENSTASPAGTIKFTFDGNAGDPEAVMDLAAKNNAFNWSSRVPRIEIEVSGLPANSSFTLYCG